MRSLRSFAIPLEDNCSGDSYRSRVGIHRVPFFVVTEMGTSIAYVCIPCKAFFNNISAVERRNACVRAQINI